MQIPVEHTNYAADLRHALGAVALEVRPDTYAARHVTSTLERLVGRIALSATPHSDLIQEIKCLSRVLVPPKRPQEEGDSLPPAEPSASKRSRSVTTQRWDALTALASPLPWHVDRVVVDTLHKIKTSDLFDLMKLGVRCFDHDFDTALPNCVSALAVMRELGLPVGIAVNEICRLAILGDTQQLAEFLDRHPGAGLLINLRCSDGPLIGDYKDSVVQGVAPMHLAVAWRRKEMVTALHQQGADLNVLATFNRTPLMIASGGCGLFKDIEATADLVRHLCELGANVDATDQQGNTALHGAILTGNTPVIDALLQAGAKNIPNLKGTTPLLLAVHHGLTRATTQLLNYPHFRDAINSPGSDGVTLLTRAMCSGWDDLTELLISLGASTECAEAFKANSRSLLSHLWMQSRSDYKKLKGFVLQKGRPIEVERARLEVRSIILGHAAKIKGTFLMGTRVVSLEGAYPHAILRFMAGVTANPGVKAALTQGSQTGESTDAGLLARAYAAGETLLLPVSWRGHALTIVLQGSTFLLCNRGRGSRWCVEGWTIDSALLRPMHLAALLADAGDQQAFEDKCTRIIAEVSGRKAGLAEWIEKSSSLAAQLVGNCAWESSETGVFAILMLQAIAAANGDCDQVDLQSVHNDFLRWQMTVQVAALERFLGFDKPWREVVPSSSIVVSTLEGRSAQWQQAKAQLSGGEGDAFLRRIQAAIEKYVAQYHTFSDVASITSSVAWHHVFDRNEYVRQILALPNAVLAGGYTPLTLHVRRGDFEMVTRLLEVGADLQLQDGRLLTPLAEAVDRRHLEMIQFLVGKGADLNRLSPLAASIAANRQQVVDCLLSIPGIDVTSIGKDGKSALDLALEACDETLMRKFQLAGFDLNKPLPDGNYVVTRALRKGADQAAMIRDLTFALKMGASFDVRTADGSTPLTIAVRRRTWAVVNWLLDHGANPAFSGLSKDNQPVWPLNLACDDAALTVGTCEKFVTKGADLNTESGGLTPLFLAVSHGASQICKYLLEHGADPRIGTDYSGACVLHRLVALDSRFTSSVRSILSQHPEQAHRVDSGGRTPLHHWASSVASLKSHFVALRTQKADIEATDASGRTPLHQAVVNGKAAVDILLEDGANVDAIDTQGNTPLHLVLSSKQSKVSRRAIVGVLFRRGATADDEVLALVKDLGDKDLKFLVTQKASPVKKRRK